MSRSLSPREKRLLIACVTVIFLVANALGFREFDTRRRDLAAEIATLEEQSQANHAWLKERSLWDKRMKWLDAKMSFTDSAGRSQGQLLEELQTSALDAELKIVSNPTLLEPFELDHCYEVAVNLKLRGDQDKMLHWLLTLQSPELFHVMKSFELELDPKAKEKTPQAQCNLTLARWFNKNPPEETGDKTES